MDLQGLQVDLIIYGIKVNFVKFLNANLVHIRSLKNASHAGYFFKGKN